MLLCFECLRLRSARLAWDVEYINPNRDARPPPKSVGGGDQPHIAHQHCDRINIVGANVSQLANACCMGGHPPGPARDEHMYVNERLIALIKGLAATSDGTERHLSVWWGHTV